MKIKTTVNYKGMGGWINVYAPNGLLVLSKRWGSTSDRVKVYNAITAVLEHNKHGLVLVRKVA